MSWTPRYPRFDHFSKVVKSQFTALGWSPRHVLDSTLTTFRKLSNLNLPLWGGVQDMSWTPRYPRFDNFSKVVTSQFTSLINLICHGNV